MDIFEMVSKTLVCLLNPGFHSIWKVSQELLKYLELVYIVNDMLRYRHDDGLSMKWLRKCQLTLKEDLSWSQLVCFEEEAFFNAIWVKYVLYDLIGLLQKAFFTQNCSQYGIFVLYNLTKAQLLDFISPDLLFHFRTEDFGLPQQQITKAETFQSSQGLEKVVIMWCEEHVFHSVWNCVEQGPELTIEQSNPLHIRDDGMILPESIWKAHAQNKHVFIDIIQINDLPISCIGELRFQLICLRRYVENL